MGGAQGEMSVPKTGSTISTNRYIVGFLRVRGVQGGGGNWGTLRIPFGKIGEP